MELNEKNDVYLFPEQPEEQVGHCTCLHSAWSSLSFPRSIQITLVSMLKPLLRVNDIVIVGRIPVECTS